MNNEDITLTQEVDPDDRCEILFSVVIILTIELSVHPSTTLMSSIPHPQMSFQTNLIVFEPLEMRLQIRDQDALKLRIVSFINGHVLGQALLKDGSVADPLQHFDDVSVVDGPELVLDDARVFPVVTGR